MPPDDPVFFVDADLSDKWFFRVLEEAGIAFERHDDHFSPGTDDLVSRYLSSLKRPSQAKFDKTGRKRTLEG